MRKFALFSRMLSQLMVDRCIFIALLYNFDMRPINPYIVGNPVKDKTGFFGRQDIFRDVMRVLRQRESNAIVLYGQRRIGKTSVLLQLEKQLAAEGEFTPVYFDLQDKAAKSLPEVLFDLSQHISRVTGHTVASPADFGRTGDYFRATFLPQIAEKVASGGLVLLFDEFDVLDSPLRTQASEAFFPYLRQWMTDLQKVKFVFVIGRRPEDLSVRTMYSFKDIQSTRVSFLTPKDAENVIRQSERNGSLKWDDSAVRRVLELSHAHPYFTQLLCSVVWENANEEAPGAASVVVARDVENAIPQALKFGANAFNWLWDGLPPAERVVVAAMAEIKDEVITQEKLIETLNQSGVRLVARELEFAPETLIDWEVLIKAEGGYRFAVPLLRRWVLANRPLRRVKDELDRLDPLADTLFQAGQGFYNNNDADTAEQQLRQSLNINPNHLKARLLLGRILLEKGRLSESVDVFEIAYQYDGAARADYVKSLLALAESQAQDETAQFAAYERILKIQPDQPLAVERIRAIWSRRGEAAMAATNYDEAIRAFEQAGQAEMVEKARNESKIKRLLGFMLQAQDHESAGRWKQAVEAYQSLESEYADFKLLQTNLANARAQWRATSLRQLQNLEVDEKPAQALELCDNLEKNFTDDEEIKACIETARAQLGVTQKYYEALGALQSGQADQARQMLSQVLAANPRHLQAAHKLIESTYGKVSITRPAPAGAWIPAGITGLLWVLLGTLAAGGLLWNALAGSIFDRVRAEFPSGGWLSVESLIVAVVALAALVGILVTLWARWSLDSAFRVEARENRSLWRALVAHLPFGLGLFYANRLAWRRWLYPLFALSLPVMLLVSPLLLKSPFENIKNYNPNLLEYYAGGTVRLGVIERASEKEGETPWNIALWAAGGAYLLSLVDALVTTSLKKARKGGHTAKPPLPFSLPARLLPRLQLSAIRSPEWVIKAVLSGLVWLPITGYVGWQWFNNNLVNSVALGLALAALAAWVITWLSASAGELDAWFMGPLSFSLAEAFFISTRDFIFGQVSEAVLIFLAINLVSFVLAARQKLPFLMVVNAAVSMGFLVCLAVFMLDGGMYDLISTTVLFASLVTVIALIFGGGLLSFLGLVLALVAVPPTLVYVGQGLSFLTEFHFWPVAAGVGAMLVSAIIFISLGAWLLSAKKSNITAA